MSSTEKAKKEAILPSDPFKYLNSIKLYQPQLIDMWRKTTDSSYDRHHIPPPGHRVMMYKAKREGQRILSMIEDAYSFPDYNPACFKEFLQWLHRFDFTQDDEEFFNRFIYKIMPNESQTYPIPILQTQTHKFAVVIDCGLSTMNAPGAAEAGKKRVKKEKSLWLTHEFNPPLQVERDSDTEEHILPLRFGLALGRVKIIRKGAGLQPGYSSFHLVFHPIDKSFWMVVDRYEGWERYEDQDDLDDTPEYQYLDNKERAQRLRHRFKKRNDVGIDMAMAEAFRLGSKDLWFPQGFGLSELDGDQSEEPVLRLNDRDLLPTIEFSSFPKVPVFPDNEAPQVRFATHSSFQSYLAENGVVKGRSWLSVSPLPN